MEPSYSLQDHIFSRLDTISYRGVNAYTSLEHGPPPANTYLDKIALAPNGDRDTSSIDLILSQDCGGSNLGSFLIRRSTWTDRLLDIWWDPVLYEQNYMEWQHKEQDALGYLYDHHPGSALVLPLSPNGISTPFLLGPAAMVSILLFIIKRRTATSWSTWRTAGRVVTVWARWISFGNPAID